MTSRDEQNDLEGTLTDWLWYNWYAVNCIYSNKNFDVSMCAHTHINQKYT